jgi:hypothetical protein
MKNAFFKIILVLSAIATMVGCGGGTNPSNRQSNPVHAYHGLANDVPYRKNTHGDPAHMVCQEPYTFDIGDSTGKRSSHLSFVAGEEKTYWLYSKSPYGDLKMRLEDETIGIKDPTPVVGHPGVWKISWKPKLELNPDRKNINILVSPVVDGICFKGQSRVSLDLEIKGEINQPAMTVTGLDENVYAPDAQQSFEIEASDPTLTGDASREIILEYPPAVGTNEISLLEANNAFHCDNGISTGRPGNFRYKCVFNANEIAKLNAGKANGLKFSNVRIAVKSPVTGKMSVKSSQRVIVNFPSTETSKSPTSDKKGANVTPLVGDQKNNSDSPFKNLGEARSKKDESMRPAVVDPKALGSRPGAQQTEPPLGSTKQKPASLDLPKAPALKELAVKPAATVNPAEAKTADGKKSPETSTSPSKVKSDPKSGDQI